MDEHTRKPSVEERDRGAGEESPDHASASPIGANVAIPVNAEVAANVLASSGDAASQASSDAAHGEH